MAVLTWNESNTHLYETGVKKGVLFVKSSASSAKNGYGVGVAWRGLTAVTESPSGAEATPLYADDEKYLNLVSAEEFGGTIEAYTYPDEFAVCNGEAALGNVNGLMIGQQVRKEFGFSYVTTVGNGEVGTEYGRKIHIVYNCLAATSEKAYATINNDPEAITFSWEFSTTPVNVGIEGFKSTSIITIDTTKLAKGTDGELTDEAAAGLKSLEEALYGTADSEPYLPTPLEIATMFGYTAASGN